MISAENLRSSSHLISSVLHQLVLANPQARLAKTVRSTVDSVLVLKLKLNRGSLPSLVDSANYVHFTVI